MCISTSGRPFIYAVEQLPAQPDQVTIPEDPTTIVDAYGDEAQAAAAVLLIALCVEHRNIWQGFTRDMIVSRSAKENWNARFDGSGHKLFYTAMQAATAIRRGLPALVERELLHLERIGEGDDAREVYLPTQKFLDPLQNFVDA